MAKFTITVSRLIHEVEWRKVEIEAATAAEAEALALAKAQDYDSDFWAYAKIEPIESETPEIDNCLQMNEVL